MSGPLAKPVESASAAWPILPTNLPDDLERRMRVGVGTMSRKLKSVPIAYRSWRFDVTRSARKQKPAGKLPEYALACLRSGAPLADVLKPINELTGWIRSFAPRLKLAEAIEAQAEEMGEANTAAIRLVRDESDLNKLDEFIKEANEAMVAIQDALDAAYKLRYEEKSK